MARYIAQRLLQSVATIFIVVTLTFVLLHAAPGDPLSTQFRDRPVPQDVVDRYRTSWGLDLPIHIQYLRYIGNISRGRLGPSFAWQRPVSEIILEAVPHTMLLALSGLVISLVLGIGMGTLQGANPHTNLDRALTVIALALFSIPVFWLGLMMLLVFGETLGWFPIGTAMSPVYSALPFLGKVSDRLHHLVLPALTLGLGGAAVIARFHRAEMIEAFTQPFVRVARAKGLPEKTVMTRHALRNALMPAITILGLSLPVLFSGSVLVEFVFAWPGIGRAAAVAVETRDYNLVTAIALFGSVMVVAGNAIADVLYRIADPRTRAA